MTRLGTQAKEKKRKRTAKAGLGADSQHCAGKEEILILVWF